MSTDAVGKLFSSRMSFLNLKEIKYIDEN